jgi:hypothetical protein
LENRSGGGAVSLSDDVINQNRFCLQRMMLYHPTCRMKRVAKQADIKCLYKKAVKRKPVGSSLVRL